MVQGQPNQITADSAVFSPHSVKGFLHFLCRKKPFIIGIHQNANCAHNPETHRYGDFSAGAFIHQKKISLIAIRKCNCFTLSDVKTGSKPKVCHSLWIIYRNHSDKRTVHDLFRFITKARVFGQFSEYSPRNQNFTKKLM